MRIWVIYGRLRVFFGANNLLAANYFFVKFIEGANREVDNKSCFWNAEMREYKRAVWLGGKLYEKPGP